MGYESPFTATKISSIPEELTTGAGGMTIPLHMQRGGGGPMSAMLHHHHQPRSKFMITDILGGAGGKLQSSENEDDERTPSPQPRDLSASSLRHHHDESDEDQSDSSMLDDHSVCSGNYQFSPLFFLSLPFNFHVCNITSHSVEFFARTRLCCSI